MYTHRHEEHLLCYPQQALLKLVSLIGFSLCSHFNTTLNIFLGLIRMLYKGAENLTHEQFPLLVTGCCIFVLVHNNCFYVMFVSQAYCNQKDVIETSSSVPMHIHLMANAGSQSDVMTLMLRQPSPPGSVCVACMCVCTR